MARKKRQGGGRRRKSHAGDSQGNLEDLAAYCDDPIALLQDGEYDALQRWHERQYGEVPPIQEANLPLKQAVKDALGEAIRVKLKDTLRAAIKEVMEEALDEVLEETLEEILKGRRQSEPIEYEDDIPF